MVFSSQLWGCSWLWEVWCWLKGPVQIEVPHGSPRCSGFRMCIAHQKTTTSATPGPVPCEMAWPSASCQPRCIVGWMFILPGGMTSMSMAVLAVPQERRMLVVVRLVSFDVSLTVIKPRHELQSVISYAVSLITLHSQYAAKGATAPQTN